MTEHDQSETSLSPVPTQSKSAIALRILHGRPRWRTPNGRAFIDIDHVAVPLRKSEALHEFVAAEFYARTSDTIGANAIEQAAITAAGDRLETREVALRIEGNDREVFINLADADGRVVRIAAGGIDVVTDGPAFVRPPGTTPMPFELVRPGDVKGIFDDFFRLAAIDDEHNRACFTGFLVGAMRPRGPYAIASIRGSQNAGKTLRARLVRRLIDPRIPEDLELPNHTRNLAILAEHAHLLVFDNISIVPQKLSDALCRLATGSGFITRAVRTDRDLASFFCARPIILTSIGEVSAAPDLLDRSLLIDLPPLEERKGETELFAAFDRLRPRLLGALAHAVHVALADHESITVPSEIRMVEAARFASAAEQVTGLRKGAVIDAFMRSRHDATLITAMDPVVERILTLIDKETAWEGQLIELLDKLHGPPGLSSARARYDLPHTARALRERLDRLAQTLRGLGVDVDLTGLHPRFRTRIVRLTRVLRAVPSAAE